MGVQLCDDNCSPKIWGRCADPSTLAGNTASADTPENKAALQAKLKELSANGKLSRSQGFKTADDAAKYVLTVTAPLSREYGLEIGGNIYLDRRGDGLYHYTLPQVGTSTWIALDPRWDPYHTHPNGSSRFSNEVNNHGVGGDSRWVFNSEKSLYLGTQTLAGKIFTAVCEPTNCSDTARLGTPGRVIE